MTELSESDRPFDGVSLPRGLGWAEPWLHDLTYLELHAMELGLLGLFAGVGWASGFRQEVGAGSIVLIGIALGLRALPADMPVAARVIRREPWYFTTVYVVLAALGAVFAGLV